MEVKKLEYTALYRKFRPLKFDEIVGQRHIVRTLKNELINDRVGHAYLFNGGRGTGKTSAAKILARAVNCLNLRMESLATSVQFVKQHLKVHLQI